MFEILKLLEDLGVSHVWFEFFTSMEDLRTELFEDVDVQSFVIFSKIFKTFKWLEC